MANIYGQCHYCKRPIRLSRAWPRVRTAHWYCDPARRETVRLRLVVLPSVTGGRAG